MPSPSAPLPRPRWTLTALAIVTTTALVVCGGRGYLIEGPGRWSGSPPLVREDATDVERFMARAQPPPRIELAPFSLFEAGEPVEGRVVAHAGAAAEGARRLVVAIPGRGVARILYELPAGLRIPARRGEDIVIRWQPEAPEGETRGPALLVHDREGGLRAAITLGAELRSPTGDEEVRLSPSRHLAFSEMLQLPSLCTALLEHRSLDVTTPEGTRILAPGSLVELMLQGRPHTLLVLDVALPVDERCEDLQHGQVSYALIASALPR